MRASELICCQNSVAAFWPHTDRLGHSLTSSHSTLFICLLPLSLSLFFLGLHRLVSSPLTSHRSSYIAVTQTYRRTDSQIGRHCSRHQPLFTFPHPPHHIKQFACFLLFVQSVGTFLWVRLLVLLVVRDHMRTHADVTVEFCLLFLTPLGSVAFSVVECLSTRQVCLVSFFALSLCFIDMKHVLRLCQWFGQPLSVSDITGHVT